MKYKCIKNYWMDNESAELGHTPAFVDGMVYDFNVLDSETLVTYKDNHKREHFMDKDELDNSGYFELVEECCMSNKQWLEGATYEFRKGMLNEFTLRYSSNANIASLIGNKTFTVKRVDLGGKVIDLVEFRRDDLEIDYWFDAAEMDYFDMVVDLRDMNNTNNIRPVADIVVEFLDKLVYVSANDYTVTDMLYLNKDGAVLTTDFADFRGGKQIYEFVTQRYELLQQEAKHKKNDDLMERKAKLEAELAEVNKELGDV